MTNKPSTFLDAAIGCALDESGGRFAKSAPTFPSANVYPKLPEHHPSNQHAKVPDEPPLGIDVNYVPPVGEKFELGEVAPPSSSSPDGGASPSPAPADDPVPKGSIPDDYVGASRVDGTPVGNSLDMHKFKGG